MRALALAVLTGVSVSVAAPAALAEAVTTRIETRPFYGATVTLEEGVRVFRPLPRHDRVIINPGGQTPLSLSYSESRNYSFNEFVGGGHSAGSYGPAYYGASGNVLPRASSSPPRPRASVRPAALSPGLNGTPRSLVIPEFAASEYPGQGPRSRGICDPGCRQARHGA